LPQFEFGVMLLFHTIHRAGSARLPIAFVDRYVNVPVPSIPPTLGLLELSLTGRVRFATLIVQRGAEWTGRESVECTEGSYHLVHALVPFLTFHFLLRLSGQSVRPRPPPFCHRRLSCLLSWFTVFSVRCAKSTSIPRPLVGQVMWGGVGPSTARRLSKTASPFFVDGTLAELRGACLPQRGVGRILSLGVPPASPARHFLFLLLTEPHLPASSFSFSPPLVCSFRHPCC